MQFTVQLGKHEADPVLLLSIGTQYLIRFELDLFIIAAGFHIELKWNRLYHEVFKRGRGNQSHIVEAGPIVAHAVIAMPQRPADGNLTPGDA